MAPLSITGTLNECIWNFPQIPYFRFKILELKTKTKSWWKVFTLYFIANKTSLT